MFYLKKFDPKIDRNFIATLQYKRLFRDICIYVSRYNIHTEQSRFRTNVRSKIERGDRGSTERRRFGTPCFLHEQFCRRWARVGAWPSISPAYIPAAFRARVRILVWRFVRHVVLHFYIYSRRILRGYKLLYLTLIYDRFVFDN